MFAGQGETSNNGDFCFFLLSLNKHTSSNVLGDSIHCLLHTHTHTHTWHTYIHTYMNDNRLYPEKGIFNLFGKYLCQLNNSIQ